MRIYYDRFEQEYVEKIDLFAAPERYYQLSYFKENFENVIDGFVEVWLLENMNYIHVRYNKEDLEDPEYINEIRKNMFEKHDCKPLFMVEWIVPKNIYNDIKNYMIGE